jgi:hypothetical protein
VEIGGNYVESGEGMQFETELGGALWYDINPCEQQLSHTTAGSDRRVIDKALNISPDNVSDRVDGSNPNAKRPLVASTACTSAATNSTKSTLQRSSADASAVMPPLVDESAAGMLMMGAKCASALVIAAVNASASATALAAAVALWVFWCSVAFRLLIATLVIALALNEFIG